MKKTVRLTMTRDLTRELNSVLGWCELGFTVQLSQRGWPKGRDAKGHDTYAFNQCYSRNPLGGVRSSVPDTIAQDGLDIALAEYYDRHNPVDDLMFN
jgi:hypothetical protein